MVLSHQIFSQSSSSFLFFYHLLFKSADMYYITDQGHKGDILVDMDFRGLNTDSHEWIGKKTEHFLSGVRVISDRFWANVHENKQEESDFRRLLYFCMEINPIL